MHEEVLDTSSHLPFVCIPLFPYHDDDDDDDDDDDNDGLKG